MITFLHSHIAGIRILDDAGPGEAGYRRFVVAPRPGAGLQWAEAEHDSPYGRIRSAWRLAGGDLHVEVTVPPGSRATVVLPDGRTTEAGPGNHTFG